ncbi:restriction endonuclease subunit S [Lacticaseibacillus paracasei]|uniref:restriction endonuclease subunit S n=1 Tax=Lacticaseibacillus paracasei TaxID=1597 RepID=UPI0035A60B4D
MGELANIRRGASPRPIKNKKWFSQTSQVGWIRISDVTEQNGRIHQVEQHLSDAGQKKTLVLKSKHLLLSIAATVGKPVQNYIQVGVHDGFIVFMDPKFDLDFMFYFLEKYRPNWARFGQPGSQININSELVRDLVVSIPTAHEQVAVAQFIITLDNLIAATQDKIDALEQAKKALLQRLFDQSWRFKGYSDPWEKRKLGEIFNVVTDYVANGSFKSLRQRVSTYSNPNFAYMIRLQDASNNWKGPWLYTDQQSYSFLAKTKLNPGDILMSNVGSVGKFFLVPDLDRPMTLAPNAILLRSMTYSTYFLFQLLQTSSMTESINEKTTPGVQQKINKTDLKKIITNVPTLNESSMVPRLQ